MTQPGIKLHPGQSKVYRSKARFRVVVAGRRWGKTKLSQAMILKYARIPKRKIWYVAPTYRMAKQIMWRELVDIVPKRWVKKTNETALSILLINNTLIELKGADDPDSLRGVGIHFLVLDEFQDMTEEVWTVALRPTLADTGGDALFIGCVNERTKILKRSGVARIDSLATGSEDKTLDKLDLDLYGLDKTFHNADGFWNNGVVETRKIRTHMGFELESSLPHPVWTIDQNGNQSWKKTEEIAVGDRVAIAREMEIWGNEDPLKGWNEHVENWRQQFKDKNGPKPKELKHE